MKRREVLGNTIVTMAGGTGALVGCDASKGVSAAAPVDDARKRRLAENSSGPNEIPVPSQLELDAAASKWVVWTEPKAGGPNPLLVKAGSALDLSAMATSPVNSRLGKRGLGFNLLGFKLPAAADIPTYVNAVKRNGHAYLRFFALDPWFGRGKSVYPPGDPFGCSYDEKTVDLWWRYLAALSDAGIQYSVEFMYIAAAMLPGRNAWPDKPDPASESMVLRATLNEPNALRHWKNCFEVLCNRPNPYFAKPRKIIDDANCLFIGSVNENNLWNRGLDYFGRGVDDAGSYIQGFFDKWQYANGATTHAVPSIRGGSAAASTAYGKFLLDVHAQSYKAMRNHAQSAGFKGKMSAVNYVPGVFDGVLRAETLDMVDCHMYYDLDDHGVGSANRSLIGDKFYNSNWLASGFVYGKRACITEFAMGGPSPWGYEFPFVYALAALQDVDWIAQFARMDNTLDPLDTTVWTNWFDKHVQVGQDATKDVVAAAASRIGAFLFNRGDVTRSSNTLGFVVRRDKTLAINPPWHANWPRTMIALGLLCGVRSVHEADVDGSLKWVGSGPAPTRIYDPFNDSGVSKKPLAKWIAELKAEGILGKDNISDDSLGIYESDNRQLRINSLTRAARVVTARSHMIIWDDDATVDETPFLMLDAATDKGLISIHDMSATPSELAATTRALLIHVTEVRGSKSDGSGPYDFAPAGTTQWGPTGYNSVPSYAISGPKGSGWRKESWTPSRIRGGKSVIRLALAAGKVTVYRLDIRGNRLSSVPVQRMKDSTVRLVLDNTAAGDLQQTVYYEVTVEKS